MFVFGLYFLNLQWQIRSFGDIDCFSYFFFKLWALKTCEWHHFMTFYEQKCRLGSATTSQPLTAEINSSDHLATVQYSAGKLWILTRGWRVTQTIHPYRWSWSRVWMSKAKPKVVTEVLSPPVLLYCIFINISLHIKIFLHLWYKCWIL